MEYTCRLDGAKMICSITSDRDLAAPILCFSGMAPMTATKGGERLRGMGSFTEVALPDLKAGHPHEVVVEYTDGHRAANRAWLPLGPYLRAQGEAIALPYHPKGRVPPLLPDLGPIDGLPLVPQPVNWTPSDGTVDVTGVQCGDDALTAVADLAARRGWRFDGDFPVRITTADMAADAYRLQITPKSIHITAGDYGGRFYAGVTLLTLMQAGPLPCGVISDAPRFGWRGQHLDTARHYYQPQTILDLLDLMALLKLNRFHWHFADDEAFRLEIDSFPELWQKTAFCGEGHLLPALFAGGIKAGGSYSKATARQIIARAATLNIEVMPEIEAPAHALAMTHVFPDMRDPADNGPETSVQGYQGNCVNPAMPRTWDVLDAIAIEVGNLFPFGHLHLGCDELPKDTWMGSPKARALMKEKGLNTTQDLQGWTIAKLAETVVQNGQRPAAWEEAAQGANGGIGHDAILFSWTGQGPGLEAARAGYDVVMSPAQHVYLDMAHSADPDDWGASWAAFISLADTINWDPVPDPALADRIIGVQGTFWSEFTTEDSQIWPMLMPRMLGVAVKAWQVDPISADNLTRLAVSYQRIWPVDRAG
ncbi:beta-N-acetylhexosaminidase [Aliiroseovarius sp. S2029]|uniref:beta-N-acetylhexosaminidase n=1 Tax=Aliiroseovarius sp. S2029 TaxID=2936988 RepID=UPI0020BE32EA|nr:family 20 glycosylhydrolase [Aliiroseovarius sp. S2029]MCK8485067.1 beta-N-acetylhexosaminidase [Aliiroseovarius sp. S2029]